jgi:hypothetical protein
LIWRAALPPCDTAMVPELGVNASVYAPTRALI